METFTVTEVIDGDTFVVSPGWIWDGNEGDRVRPTSYDTPEIPSSDGYTAKQKLSRLLLNKQVQLGNVATIDRGRLVCDAYINGRNLASYFPEYSS